MTVQESLNTGRCFLRNNYAHARAAGARLPSAISEAEGAVRPVQVRTAKLRGDPFASWWSSEAKQTLLARHWSGAFRLWG